MPSRTGRGSGNCNFVLVAPQSPEERHPEEYCNCIIMRPGCGVLRDEGRGALPRKLESSDKFPSDLARLTVDSFCGELCRRLRGCFATGCSPKRRIAGNVSPPIP